MLSAAKHLFAACDTFRSIWDQDTTPCSWRGLAGAGSHKVVAGELHNRLADCRMGYDVAVRQLCVWADVLKMGRWPLFCEHCSPSSPGRVSADQQKPALTFRSDAAAFATIEGNQVAWAQILRVELPAFLGQVTFEPFPEESTRELPIPNFSECSIPSTA
jgi:hypothetical protein